MSLWVAEPPPAFQTRPPAVVDASVLAAFIFREPEADMAEAQLRPYALHAPTILPLEIANVAMNKWRRQVAPAEALAERLAGFDFSCIELATPAAAEVYALCIQYSLTAYDAAYLWLASELRAPLITFDARLAAAAREHLAK